MRRASRAFGRSFDESYSQRTPRVYSEVRLSSIQTDYVKHIKRLLEPRTHAGQVQNKQDVTRLSALVWLL